MVNNYEYYDIPYGFPINIVVLWDFIVIYRDIMVV